MLGLKSRLVGLSELLLLPLHHVPQWLKTARPPGKAQLRRDEVNTNCSPREGPWGTRSKLPGASVLVDALRPNKTQWEQVQRVTFLLCKVMQREGDGFVEPAK